jgi:hypothetical protein
MMATHSDVLSYLRPNGGYVSRGTEYAGIEFIECEPFTEAEYKSAFDKVDAADLAKKEAAQTAKATAQAKLTALGLTTDDLKALGL